MFNVTFEIVIFLINEMKVAKSGAKPLIIPKNIDVIEPRKKILYLWDFIKEFLLSDNFIFRSKLFAISIIFSPASYALIIDICPSKPQIFSKDLSLVILANSLKISE